MLSDDQLEQYTVRETHRLLPEQMRLENALAIWLRDMRTEQLKLVEKGGRLSVAGLAYEEVLRLRGIIQKGLGADRKRRIQGRWDRRKDRRILRRAHDIYKDTVDRVWLDAPYADDRSQRCIHGNLLCADPGCN